MVHESPCDTVLLVYDLARSKNWKMKDGEMDLIAQPLLESRTCAYIEWLANELSMTADKTHT